MTTPQLILGNSVFLILCGLCIFLCTHNGDIIETNMNKTQTETSAGIIIYRKTSEGLKFLLLYQGGRYWSFPKGKLDGESNFRAALREVKEETGISPRELKFFDWFRVKDNFIYTRNGEKIYKTVTYYLAQTDRVDIRIKTFKEDQNRESHQGYGWFAYEDALRILMHPNLRRNIKRAYETIENRKQHERQRRVSREGVSRNEKDTQRKGSNV